MLEVKSVINSNFGLDEAKQSIPSKVSDHLSFLGEIVRSVKFDSIQVLEFDQGMMTGGLVKGGRRVDRHAYSVRRKERIDSNTI